MKKILAITILMFLLPGLSAQDNSEEELEAVPPPPDIPEAVQSGQPIEPDVTIIRKDDAVIEEYRVNGILYMVKVTPNVGMPYYLIDRDGDGSMESHRRGIKEDPGVPQWILFSW
ncbi:MAG: DUF2782 domain-containing protein [Gammaproteobacteria bacterium]